MATDLPGNNYNAPVSNEDLVFEQAVYRDEFLERLRLVFGHPSYLSSSSHGIVAETDPTAVTTSSAAPLVVTTSGLTLGVSAGMAVTKAGHRIALPNGIVGKIPASTEPNAVNIVALKYFTANPSEQVVNEFGVPVYVRREEPEEFDRAVVYTLSQWNALTTAQQEDHVALAAVTVVTDSGGSPSLSVTHANTSYSFLRPWFSAVDIEHRQQIGSGTASSTNPHGLTFNDLAIGNFTLPMLMNHVGLVVAQEKSYPKVAGTVCTTVVPASLLQTDTTGLVTGTVGLRYIDLGFYPVTLGAVYDSSDSTKHYAFVKKPKTTIIYLPSTSAQPPSGTNLTVMCSRVTSLEPPAGATVTQFAAGSLGSYDAVLASGKIYVTGQTVTLTDALSDVAAIPLKYRFYFADGKIVKNPQVILCNTKLSAMGSGVTPGVTPFGRGTVFATLDQAASGPSLSVKVRVTGKDPNGTNISEVLQFGSSWIPYVPNVPNTTMGAFVRGSTVFASISMISLDESLNMGSNAGVQVWLIMDPTTTPELSYAAPVAEAQWDGSKLVSILDLRPVHYDLQRPSDLRSTMQTYLSHRARDEVSGTLSGTPWNLYAEDLCRPLLSSLLPVSPTSWGIAMSPDAIWGSDRTRHTLDGYYESRALPVYPGPTKVLVQLFPQWFVFDADEDAGSSIFFRTQDATTGTWSSYSLVSFQKYTLLTIPANTGALQVRLVGRNPQGLALATYSA